MKVLFVGNKSDLQRDVDINEVRSYTESIKPYLIESSALEGVNVQEAFRMLAEGILNERQDDKKVNKK